MPDGLTDEPGRAAESVQAPRLGSPGRLFDRRGVRADELSGVLKGEA